jgi:transcriptional antiterminator RfaH
LQAGNQENQMPDSISIADIKPDTTPKSGETTSVKPVAAEQPSRLAIERQGPASSLNTPSSRWYVAQTHLHAEGKALQHLRRQGFDVYLPRYLKQRRHARRIDTVAAPLFPRYLFVSIDLTAQRWYSIDSTIGIAKLIRYGDVPVAVPDAIVEGLRCRENADGFVQLERQPRFAPGDKIRISHGAFCDCLGLYETIRGNDRSAILLDLLGRKVRVVLENALIDAA